MAAPTINGTRTTTVGSTTDSRSFSITLPSSIQAGERLVVLLSLDSQSANETTTAPHPGNGWERAGELASGSTYGAVWTKIADGGGNDAFTVIDPYSPSQFTAIALRISSDANCLELASASGNSTDSNPPSLTHNGGAVDTLWLAFRAGDAQVVPSAAPSGFSNLTNATAAGSGGASTSVADYSANGATLDPGVFTVNTEQWVCFTIALYAGTASYGRISQHAVEVVAAEAGYARLTNLVVEVAATAMAFNETADISITAAHSLTVTKTTARSGTASVTPVASSVTASGSRVGSASVIGTASVSVAHSAAHTQSVSLAATPTLSAAGYGGETTGTPAMMLVVAC